MIGYRVAALFGVVTLAFAQQAEPKLEKIAIEPRAGFVTLPHGQHSFLVTGYYADGSVRDLTRDASYSISDPGVLKQAGRGLFEAAAEGVAKVAARVGGLSAEAAVVVNPPVATAWDFAADIAPIFSKLGCNNSNCHGAINGQNGFKLSLFGYDPDEDYEAVVKRSNGRRVNLAKPEESLILRKPTFSISHGGGKPMEKDSLEYATLLKWIGEGCPKGKPSNSRLSSIRVWPSEFRVIGGVAPAQQLLAIGYYSDGSRVDLTRRVRYESSDETVAAVSPAGLVIPKRNGEVTILVRTLGKVSSAHIGVALNTIPIPHVSIAHRNFIDDLVFGKLAQMKLLPSPLSRDSQFIRRVYLDAIGTLPTPSEVAAFLADRRADKRDRLIDVLLERPEYASFWAVKWGDLFMMAPLYVHDNSPYSHEYFRRNFASDKPYNQVAREMITGLGTWAEVGPNNFYTRENRRSHEEYATFVTQTFLGVSLECARCHNHPKEKWTRDDFLGLAAFFSQVKIKETVGYRPFEGLVTLDYPAEFRHPQTLQIVRPRLLGGTEPMIRPMVDRREILADWVTSADNPYFARATVNRVWRQLMGRGLVEPVDDFRDTNPPSNPELLNRLAAFFIDGNYRMKPLIAAILKSSAYQLAAATNDSNATDAVNYSHYYMRRLTAEQLLDAISDVTGVPEKFRGFYWGKRAIDLPDSGVPSYFLDTFDRPIRDTAKCERNTTVSVAQAMHFMAGETIQAKLSNPEGRLHKLSRRGIADSDIIREFYLCALSREPDDHELQMAKEFVARKATREEGLRGFAWALLNSKEFLFNH